MRLWSMGASSGRQKLLHLRYRLFGSKVLISIIADRLHNATWQQVTEKFGSTTISY
jgi:thiamine phosphate synthase YjbQ (UPF0047 family)